MLYAAYIPADRRAELAGGEPLAVVADGTALSADISGFTPLAEMLAQALGPHQGAEVLTQVLNRVYDLLIAEVDRVGGSVISFSGDAMTCWFGAPTANAAGRQSAARDAATCALALQRAMQQLAGRSLPGGLRAELAVKIGLSSGQARRFLVGDPSIQRIDVLAGALVKRLSLADQAARAGDILLDERSAALLADRLPAPEWRESSGERFAVLPAELASQLAAPTAEENIALLAQFTLLNTRPEIARPFLLPAVFARLHAGLSEFVTELRPVVAMFVRFGGIDYDADPEASTRLDTYMRWVQSVLASYDGTLIQLTIGDKGSYFYAVFGAPQAHEDDAQRAAAAALDLCALPAELASITLPQIGISQGMLRIGAYGAATRRTYGAQGGETNRAARLMSAAAPGEILMSGRAHAGLGNGFLTEPLPPIRLKGLHDPLPVFRLTGARTQTVRLQEPNYTLPMIGRDAELRTIETLLERTMAGQGQIVGITGEAGLGKSRLVAETTRLARRQGMRGFGGAGQSYGDNAPYLVWVPIWRAFFEIDPELPVRRQIRALERLVDDLAPERADALPLLGPLLGLDLPENTFTQSLAPQFRQSALHALLLECLQAAAREAADEASGLLLVLDNLQWIDAASHELLEQVGRACAALPVLIVLAYRPPRLQRLQEPRVEAMEHFTGIPLAPLAAPAAEQVLRAKLAQLLPDHHGIVPPRLIEHIIARAQGNPFAIEGLLTYLHSRGIDPWNEAAVAALDLPFNLRTLVLSRVDQLSEHQRALLKVASVIGRRFSVGWLNGAAPALGQSDTLQESLEELSQVELTALAEREPELAYLFTQIITQEVTYDSLTSRARASLHGQLARFLEQTDGEQNLDLLAFHYDHSSNLPKRREYLRRAGEAAAARYANVDALAYFKRALALVPDDDAADRYRLMRACEQIFDLQGERTSQAEALDTLEALAARLGAAEQAEVALRRANSADVTGDYPAASAAAQSALDLAAGLPALQAAAELALGRALLWQSDYAAAQAHLQRAAELARSLGDARLAASATRSLGAVAQHQGDYAAAIALFTSVLEAYQAQSDRQGKGDTHNNLGIVAYFQGDYAAAQAAFSAAMGHYRAIGDRRGEGGMLNNLGEVALVAGDFAAARAAFEQARALYQQVGDRRGESGALNSLAQAAHTQGDFASAQTHYQQSMALKRALGERWSVSAMGSQLALLLHQQGDDAGALDEAEAALELARELGARPEQAAALTVIGHAQAARGDADAAAAAYTAALDIRGELKQPHLATEPRAGLARLALAQGQADAALAQIEPILAHLADGNLRGTAEPFRVELACYEALLATNDPRATAFLAEAYSRLEARAAQISSDSERQTFLEAIPSHHALVQAWQAAQSSQTMPNQA